MAENITFERFLTERCAIPLKALNAALVLCMYDIQISLAIRFGMSEYGSMHRVIYDRPQEWVDHIDNSLKNLAISLGYEEKEFDSPGVTTNLPKFVNRGIIHTAYKETESEDQTIASFIQLAISDLTRGSIGGSNDSDGHHRSKIIYKMSEKRKQLVPLK